MRRPRFRYTLLSQMVLIGVVGIVLGVFMQQERETRRRTFCRDKIMFHQDKEIYYGLSKGILVDLIGRLHSAQADEFRAQLPELVNQEEYHKAMLEKYRQAASRPWEPLPVDLPRPMILGR
jgi:hypothetical protein